MAGIEAQQKIAEARARQERQAEMLRLADTFEKSIGEIVKSVSTTSTQVETSAYTLTAVAEMLAQRTTEATEEIRAQVGGIQTASRDSVSALKDIRGTIIRLSEVAAAIAAAVDEQDATTHGIAQNVKQVAQGTSQVAASILDVNKRASETGTASSELLASARTLARESSKLRNEAQGFLATVRTAS
jgi:methyl-accepting chemotaxis protein